MTTTRLIKTSREREGRVEREREKEREKYGDVFSYLVIARSGSISPVESIDAYGTRQAGGGV